MNLISSLFLCHKFHEIAKLEYIYGQGRRNELFSGEARKISLLYIQDAKNFSVVKPLNSGEARASPVPTPLKMILCTTTNVSCYRRPTKLTSVAQL